MTEEAEEAGSAGGYTQEQIELFRNFLEKLRQSREEALNRAEENGFLPFGIIRRIICFVQSFTH